MILDAGIRKITVKGKSTYQFNLFSQGSKHLVGMYDEINSFVSFVKDASEGGSSREMAFVLVGEPGNGKTFFVDYLCDRYREFLSAPENMKYTFRFIRLDQLSGYGKITSIESQTYEDPMILAMSLHTSKDASRDYLAKNSNSLTGRSKPSIPNTAPRGLFRIHLEPDQRVLRRQYRKNALICGGDPGAAY